MRKLGAALFLVIAMTLVVATVAGAQAGPPELTSYDVLHARVDGLTELTEADMSILGARGITAADAIQVARNEGASVDAPARVFHGSAARSLDESNRDVYLVVVRGGTFPFDGPIDGAKPDRNARVTGFIVDAETGEFLRGFMHK